MMVSRTLEGAAVASAALAVGVLGLLVAVTAVKGSSVLSLNFLTSDIPAEAGHAGGIGPALAGTAEMSLISGVISVTLGVLVALYLSEFAGPRIEGAVTLFLDLLAGMPAIVIGVFIYGLLVAGSGNNGTGLDGSLALSMVMTPLVARATMESLRRIPESWRDAAQALGIARWRTILGVVLPGASAGIATAAILALARGAGEAAPLLLTEGNFTNGLSLNPLHGMASIQILTLQQLELGFPNSIALAWGAALFLMALILFVNIGARIMLRRGERKRGL
jgi:phosphate transport system permease protein